MSKGNADTRYPLIPIDEHHCAAHVARMTPMPAGSRPDLAIDFEVHDFVQSSDFDPKVFGWNWAAAGCF
jgi:hypothetical protein